MLEGAGKLGHDRTCDNPSGASEAVKQALAAEQYRRPFEPRTRRVSSAACSTRLEVGSNLLGSTVFHSAKSSGFLLDSIRWTSGRISKSCFSVGAVGVGDLHGFANCNHVTTHVTTYIIATRMT